jgi:two-component SAPR family response regulator
LSPIAGKRILIVEDEGLVSAMVEDMLTEMGAEIAGTASTIARAMLLATTIRDLDAAVLDVNVREERIDPVAAVLFERNVPVVFATGYGVAPESAKGRAPVIGKPYTRDKLSRALIEVLVRR